MTDQPANQLIPDALQTEVAACLTPLPLWAFPSGLHAYLPGCGWTKPMSGLCSDGWLWPWQLTWDWSVGRYVRCSMAAYALLLGLTLPLVTPSVAAAELEPVTQAEVQTRAQMAVAEPVGRTVTVRVAPAPAMRGSRKKAVEPVQCAQEDAAAGIVLPAQSVHATLPDEAAPGPKARRKTERQGPQLDRIENVFTDVQVSGLVDDWLIPFLVESLMEQETEGRKGTVT